MPQIADEKPTYSIGKKQTMIYSHFHIKIYIYKTILREFQSWITLFQLCTSLNHIHECIRSKFPNLCANLRKQPRGETITKQWPLMSSNTSKSWMLQANSFEAYKEHSSKDYRMQLGTRVKLSDDCNTSNRKTCINEAPQHHQLQTYQILDYQNTKWRWSNCVQLTPSHAY